MQGRNHHHNHQIYCHTEDHPSCRGPQGLIWNVTVYVLDKNQPNLPTAFTLLMCLYLSLGLSTCISFQIFSRQLSVFTLCDSGLFFCLIGPFNSLSIYIFFLSLPEWFQRPGVFVMHCDPCQGRKGSCRLRYPLAAVCWGHHISLAQTSLRRVVGLARPNQSAGRVEP